MDLRLRNSVIPAFLTSGDKVVVLSTARKVAPSELEPAIKILTSWDLKVQLGQYIFEEDNQFAGNDIQRLSDIQTALNDPEIKAIFCARGGYGTPRIIDHINWDNFVTSPKWVVGFSDVTILLNAIQNLGICSLHAPMLLFFNKEEYYPSINSLKEYLFGKLSIIKCEHHFLNKNGNAKGILVGGNLSMIVNSISTSTAFDPIGKILVLEDIDEYLYHIDRMMMHLKRSGVLSLISGLIVGHFTDMKDNVIPFGENAYEIIHRNVQDFNYPICFGFQVGHSFQNLPIPMGNLIELNVENEGVQVKFS